MTTKILMAESAAPSTPGSGFITIYGKTDGRLYAKNDGGTEYDLTAGSGSVSSVGLALPASLFGVLNSPVSDFGTLTGTLIAQPANYVFAGPTAGGDAVPEMRALVAADIPGRAAHLIASGAVSGSPVASISFSTIPATYRALLLMAMLRGDTSATFTQLLTQFNSDTTVGNYGNQRGDLSASSPGATEQLGTVASVTGLFMTAATAPANMFAGFEILIPGYASTSFNKKVLGRATGRISASSGGMLYTNSGGMWANTAAISSIQLKAAAGNIAVNSYYTLWGLT